MPGNDLGNAEFYPCCSSKSTVAKTPPSAGFWYSRASALLFLSFGRRADCAGTLLACRRVRMAPGGPGTAVFARGILHADGRGDLPLQGFRTGPGREFDGAHAV